MKRQIVKSILTNIVIRFHKLVNKIIIAFLHKSPQYNKKYNLCLCGIFKDEAPFLEEWIIYHKLIGVEHFYLYNNNSSDNYKEAIDKFIEEGLVTLIEWPYEQGQISAYRHFYENYRNQTQWFSFLDIDEFFCPKRDASLLAWIKKRDKYPVVLVYWKMFGTGGQLFHDYNKPVLEQYINAWDNLYKCGKCLINSDYEIANFEIGSRVHHATRTYPINKIKFPILPVDQFGNTQYDAYGSECISSYLSKSADIQINHYWSKSWNIYDGKRKKTDVYFKENPKAKIEYFLMHEINNTSVDYSIFRFLVQLKWEICGQ